jgi:hypothetical protein
MKRKIATRKLKRSCKCGKTFKKGDVYYLERIVFAWGFENKHLFSNEHLHCAKCRYRQLEHERRFELFKPKCPHPIVHEVWSYIPGEYVMQPDHDVCQVCGEWIL